MSCQCWNVARDGHALDCELARESRRRLEELMTPPWRRPAPNPLDGPVYGDVSGIPPAFAGWTEPELRLAHGDR